MKDFRGQKKGLVIRWLNNFTDFYFDLIGWFIKLIVQTFQAIIVMYRRGNFVYHHWGGTYIYLLLSYPFRTLSIYSIMGSNLICLILRKRETGERQILIFLIVLGLMGNISVAKLLLN